MNIPIISNISTIDIKQKIPKVEKIGTSNRDDFFKSLHRQVQMPHNLESDYLIEVSSENLRNKALKFKELLDTFLETKQTDKLIETDNVGKPDKSSEVEISALSEKAIEVTEEKLVESIADLLNAVVIRTADEIVDTTIDLKS